MNATDSHLTIMMKQTAGAAVGQRDDHQRMDEDVSAMEADVNTKVQSNALKDTAEIVTQMEFHIVGFVKRKIVFNHRPTIVTQQPSPTKDLGSQRFV